VQVYFRDAGDLKRLYRDLGGHADLRKELRTGLRDILRPLVPVLRAAYLAGPSHTDRGRLRRLLARSVRVEVRTSGRLAGARIRADGRRMPDHMKSIPAYWEGEKSRWRHPVFGNRDVWVDQQPHPTFYRTVEPRAEQAGRAVDDLLDRVRHELESRR
jgi:hypothetical protein